MINRKIRSLFILLFTLVINILTESPDAYAVHQNIATQLFGSINNLALDTAINAYVKDADNNRTQKLNPKYVVSTLAGTTAGFADGKGSSAQFYGPMGVATDGVGNVYVADAYNHKIRKISSSGLVTTLAGSTEGFADGPTSIAKFSNPTSVAVDVAGNVYVTDANNRKIRKISSSGLVTTLAGSTYGFADGEGTVAKFIYPYGIAVDGTGNVYVSDYLNYRIRKITPSGMVSTLAGGTYGFADGQGSDAQFADPIGVAIDVIGNVYVADYGNQKIRKITSSGLVSTLAGSTHGLANGQGDTAQFYSPIGVAVDSVGNVYVTDYDNHRIQKVTSSGVVSTWAGSTQGSADGPSSVAKFNFPFGIATDASGTVYVAESDTNRIRKIYLK